MNTILVVDDEESICNLLFKIFKNDYNVLVVHNGKDALNEIKIKEIDVVLLDQNMPGYSGIETLTLIKQFDETVPVIMITAYGKIELTVKSMKLGANDYIEKPFDPKKIRLAVFKALEIRTLNKEVEHLRSELVEKNSFQNIIGQSPLIQNVFHLINNVSDTDIPVLITGESGTGKELAARAIHYTGSRKNMPFVPINCAAIPDQLLESELFGYEKGAFSGAISSKKGKIELANNGTLFLDEIGDMAERTQAKLLRFLQDSKFERLGGVDSIQVNVRFLSATNKNIDNLMSKNVFREDLYYRINAVEIDLPSLSCRKEDIVLLTEHFIKKYNKRYNYKIEGAKPEFMQLLMDYDWPGNIRELENVIQSAMVLSTDNTLAPDSLPKKFNRFKKSLENPDNIDDDGPDLTTQIEELEKILIKDALDKANNNRTQASKYLKISLRNLQYKIKKYGMADQ